MYAHQEALIKTNVIIETFLKNYREARTNSRIFFPISQDIRSTKITVIKLKKRFWKIMNDFLRVKKAFVSEHKVSFSYLMEAAYLQCQSK